MGILNLDDVPPPFGAGDQVGGRTAVAGEPAAAGTAGTGAGTAPSSSLFDTSALTAPDPAGPTGQSPASDSTPAAPTIESDPVKTLELKPLIVEQLSTIFDPEIPVNIYELGLIYDVAVDGKGLAVIQMTLTAPGCPAAITLPAEVQGKVKSIEGVSDARVDLVWEPPWDKDRMSDAAKLQLGIFD